MYTHIGGGRTVKNSRVIGVFDLETASIGKGTKIFLKTMQSEGREESVSPDLPRSVILADAGEGGEGQLLFVSPISAATLQKRGGLSQTAAIKSDWEKL